MNPRQETIARQRLPFLQSPSERKWTGGSALCLFSVPTQSLGDAVASSTSKSIISDETVRPCQMCCGPFPRQVSCCWQAVWDRYQQMPVTSTAGTRGHCRNANNAGFPKLRLKQVPWFCTSSVFTLNQGKSCIKGKPTPFSFCLSRAKPSFKWKLFITCKLLLGS